MDLLKVLLKSLFILMTCIVAASFAVPITASVYAAATGTESKVPYPKEQLKIMKDILDLVENKGFKDVKLSDLMQIIGEEESFQKGISELDEVEKMLRDDLNLELDQVGSLGALRSKNPADQARTTSNEDAATKNHSSTLEPKASLGPKTDLGPKSSLGPKTDLRPKSSLGPKTEL